MDDAARQETSSGQHKQFAVWNTRISPAIVGTGGEDEVGVDAIAYSAKRHGEDAEECIRKAVDAGEIELVRKGYRRDDDMYRLTARGRELHRLHMRRVDMISEMCLEAERRPAESDVAGQERPSGGRPPA